MNWNLVFALYLSAWGLGFVSAICVLRNKRKKAGSLTTRLDNLSMLAIMMVLASPLPLFSHLEIKDAWRKQDFSGQIMKKQATKEHALLEYTKEKKKRGQFVILDKLWKLDDFDVGDWIKKSRGQDDAIHTDASETE